MAKYHCLLDWSWEKLGARKTIIIFLRQGLTTELRQSLNL